MNKSHLPLYLFAVSGLFLLTAIFLTFRISSKIECTSKNYDFSCLLIDKYQGMVNLFRSNKDRKIISPVTITFDSLNMPKEILDPLIKEYQSKNPLVTIKYMNSDYKESDLSSYKNNLKSRLTDNNGPIIYTIHATWLNDFIDYISAHNTALTASEFKTRFFPVMARQMVNSKNEVLAIPLFYDGFGLFYNKDILLSRNLNPPSTWDELRASALELTVKSPLRTERNKILRAGLAMGEYSNIYYYADIISFIAFQSNLKFPDDYGNTEFGSLLSRYLDLSRSDGVWANYMPVSLNAFASNQVAFVFLRNSDIEKLENLNPTLNFGIAPMPQFPKIDGTQTNVALASYYVNTVSSLATKDEQQTAWEFLNWLSSDENQVKIRNEFIKYKKYTPIYSSMKLNETDKNFQNSAIRLNAKVAVSNVICDLCGNDNYANLIKEALVQFYKVRSYSKSSYNKILGELKENINIELKR